MEIANNCLIDDGIFLLHTIGRNISSSNAAAWVQVLLGGDAKLKMKVGEIAFFPLYSGQAVTAESQTAACVLEYGYWTAS